MKWSRQWFQALLLAILVVCTQFACLDEDFTTDSDKRIKYSTDTLSFDTVFTTLGSATRYFKIYNPHKEFIKLKSIRLGQGDKSPFSLNVDGVSSSEILNYELLPEDSIYIFCDITIDPLDPLELSPYVVCDSVLFEYNGNVESVKLLSWGQNANYIPSKLNKGNITFLDLQNQTLIWDDPKPYILYGFVYIDNGVLQIAPGTKLHFWGGVTKATGPGGEIFFYNDGRLIIGPNASIKAEGNFENPIVFRSVRTEKTFDRVGGQWSGIFLDKYSIGNQFSFCHIRNSLMGVYMDSLSKAKVDHCRFMFNSANALYGQQASLELNNSLFYGQGAESIYMILGGQLQINYCTFANYGNDHAAMVLSNKFCLDILCERFTAADMIARITNCVIAGSDEDELQLVKESSAAFDVFFDHCMVKSKDLHTKNFPDFFTKYSDKTFVHTSLNNLFKNISEDNFKPDSISVLNTKAKPLSNLLFDIDNKMRDGLMPDIGCFENN